MIRKTQEVLGFTLIELLIVVAIIGILAAIAIPNFMQAQVRAKVSRAQADLRSLAMAIQLYQGDYNIFPWRAMNTSASWEFPYSNPASPFNGASDYVMPMVALMQQLSTPVEYVTGLYQDPFQDGSEPYDWWGQALFGDSYWAAGTRSYLYDRQRMNMQILMPSIATPATKWGVWSIGPDHSWLDTTNATAGIGGWNYLLYDPTNGTVSLGNIWRLGP